MKKLFLLAALMSATLMLFAQPTGSKGGKFTVASGVQVRFSQGNLQYHVRNHVWQFAVRQDSVIGKTNENRIEENYNGWIDLFGWGTSGYNDKMPYMYVRDNAAYGNGAMDIAGTNYDWGVYNSIYNPKTQTTDAPGTWRTLTEDEWDYLINSRTTSSGIRYAKATVNGVTGLILVPDNWSTSTYNLNSPNTSNADYTTNVISSTQWISLENAGCVFLPAAGERYHTSLSNIGSNGTYWSGTNRKSDNDAYHLFIYSGEVGIGTWYRDSGFSVRLVRNVE